MATFWNIPPTISSRYLNLDKSFDTCSSYDKRLLIGDFNTEISKPRIDSFVYEHELQDLVKEKTCFKSAYNPICIDFLCRLINYFGNS